MSDIVVDRQFLGHASREVRKAHKSRRPVADSARPVADTNIASRVKGRIARLLRAIDRMLFAQRIPRDLNALPERLRIDIGLTRWRSLPLSAPSQLREREVQFAQSANC